MSSLGAIRLLLHNDLAELDRLAGWIESWMHEGVALDSSFAIQLCLEEAVANIIMYAAAEERDEFASPHANSFWAEVHKLAIWRG